ncbi:MAG: ribonuclease Z [Bacteroidia bacterium]|nr:ribonuclease Z [Bacteroidota bacterium]MBK8584993.1 ribonuclease Z [Bacteroidota bacterium]MBP6532203.1 ribonuclease Z [Bacteroidia bacterium]HQV99727.1 ribonuclease Z [Bacteroidia bacterium]
MVFEVSILGSSSATPIYQRHPTAQVLNIHERFFLVDCGEGTLIQLNRYKIKFHRINHIFISHLHGDHYLGLLGLLSTMHLQGRTIPIHLYCQAPLKEIIDIQLKYSETILRFPIHYHMLDPKNSAVIMEDDDLEVSTIILNHRIPCTGFLFKEKPRSRKLQKDKLQKFNVPISVYQDLKNGMDYTDEFGKVIANSELTTDPKNARSYAFCSDTCYDERILPQISEIDLLYHEATFLNDKEERAKETFHSTAAQAATIAKKANVKRLIIGHFSARYKNLYPLLDEAKEVFPETTLAMEGDVFSIL